jgi:Domain of unknown function (DUF3560)
MNSYEQKQARRKQRLAAAAENAARESTAAFQRSNSYTDGIPMGQPILVGHHSEKRHRNALKKSDNAMRKAVEASKHAEELRGRAAAVGTGGISSDDPDATLKLSAQLQTCQDWQALMVATNKLVRFAEKRAEVIPARVELVRGQLAALGFSETNMEQLFTKDFAGRTGFPAYMLQNNNANTRRIAARIAELQERPTQLEAFTPINGDGWKIFVDAEENRVCMKFEQRLSKERYTEIRSWPYSFVWSPSYSRFQRKFSANAIFYAKKFVGHIDNSTAPADEE